MIFLIEYDRRRGKLVTFKRVRDADHAAASAARLELELKAHRAGLRHEIVLLDAASEAALRRTHGRYFYTLREIIEAYA
jgi:hypothetical protein